MEKWKHYKLPQAAPKHLKRRREQQQQQNGNRRLSQIDFRFLLALDLKVCMLPAAQVSPAEEFHERTARGKNNDETGSYDISPPATYVSAEMRPV